MTVLFLRHGESLGNVDRLIQGWAEYPLTPLGERQAATAAQRLATAGVSVVYTSPLRRARQTAEVVAAACGVEVVDLPDLREYHFGEAEGLTWPEAAARWGLEERDWGVDSVPGEEGMEVFRTRVRRQCDELFARHADSTAVAVIHGGVFGALVSSLCGLGAHEHVQLYVGNCSLMAIEQDPSGAPIIASLNDRCHIEAMPAA